MKDMHDTNCALTDEELMAEIVASELQRMFVEILDYNSMTAIRWRIEALLLDVSDIDAEYLQNMIESNSLDFIWMKCHERLGNVESAKEIEAWIADKSNRDARNSWGEIL